MKIRKRAEIWQKSLDSLVNYTLSSRYVAFFVDDVS